jgi:hypothetical protein
MSGPTPTPTPGSASGSGGRFAARVGIEVETIDPALADCGCGAVATFSPPPARTAAGSASPSDPAAVDDLGGDDPGAEDPGAGDLSGDEQPVPTGALLALVDATARAAAEAAVAVPGRRTALTPTATGVQFREPARGTVTARASVPCEGAITDRADDRGLFRFSVAVEVVDPAGTRVANGTVQWLAQIDGTPTTPDA